MKRDAKFLRDFWAALKTYEQAERVQKLSRRVEVLILGRSSRTVEILFRWNDGSPACGAPLSQVQIFIRVTGRNSGFRRSMKVHTLRVGWNGVKREARGTAAAWALLGYL